MIRVLIVDDHAVVRSGLRRLLDAEADIETVGEAANADRAVFEAIEGKPDVVLMDLVMPEKGGIEGMPAVLQAAPGGTRARAFHAGRPEVRPGRIRRGSERLRPEGGCGHGGRGSDSSCLRRRAIRASRARREAHRRRCRGATPGRTGSPVRTRAEVLRLLALGHTNQEIAKQLFISVRTAETHRAHIMQKLSLSSRAELVRYALSEGLLEPE